MNESAVKTYIDYVLPLSIITKVELSRMVTDLERVNNELTSANVRAHVPGVDPQPAPKVTQQSAEFLTLNKIAFTDERVRSEVIKQLQILKDKSPVIHMTFAVEAEREGLMWIVQWLRTSIHRQALISVGLQPALVAGVYLRTPNQVHDLSLRAKLVRNRDVLIKEMEALRG